MTKELEEPLMATLDAVDDHPLPNSTPPHHTPQMAKAMQAAAKDYRDHKGDPQRITPPSARDRKATTNRRTSATDNRRTSATDNRVSYPEPNNIDGQRSDDVPEFYDEEEILRVSASLAHGYIVLLSCGEVDDQMSFAALTDGNVIDACFGVGPGSSLSGPGVQHAARRAKTVKDYVRQLPEELQPLAVECYTRAFKIVEVYWASMEEAGVWGCCKEGEIRKVAMFELRRVFRTIGTGSGVPPPPLDNYNGDNGDNGDEDVGNAAAGGNGDHRKGSACDQY